MKNQGMQVAMVFISGILACVSGGLLVTFFRMQQTGQVRMLEAIFFVVCAVALFGVVRFGNLWKRSK